MSAGYTTGYPNVAVNVGGQSQQRRLSISSQSQPQPPPQAQNPARSGASHPSHPHPTANPSYQSFPTHPHPSQGGMSTSMSMMPPPPPPAMEHSTSTGTSKDKRKGVKVNACQECKRLKLKCDKKFPCSSCVKRGCSAICPDGQFVTGKGSRFIMAGTKRLHTKIDVLSDRIRALEAGLEELQKVVKPGERHVLLSEELMKIKSYQDLLDDPEGKLDSAAGGSGDYGGAERIDLTDVEEESDNEGARVTSGTLTIRASGSSTYFGSTARAEYFLVGPEDLGIMGSPLPIPIHLLSHTFPLGTLVDTVDALRSELQQQIPTPHETKRLSDLYHTRVNWLYDPLPDSYDFIQDLRMELYSAKFGDADPHRMSLLFIILALGSLVDLEERPYSESANRYYELSRASLSLRPVIEMASITAIQTLILSCYYLLLGNKKPDPAWTMMGLAIKLAQSLGLHRDDWNLNTDEAQQRRVLWWEVVTLEGWMSLGFGRPPSVRLLTVNSKLPRYSSDPRDSQYRSWMHAFGKENLPAVLEVALGAKSPDYPTIQRTEANISKSFVPPALRVMEASPAPGEIPLALTFQRSMVITARTLTLLKLHGSWFTLALTENASDLTKSKYFDSVKATYKSACMLIACLHHLCQEHFDVVCRFGLFWSNALSAVVSLCLIATKSPSCEFAQGALKEVELCSELFQRGAGICHLATIGAPVIRKLSDKARLNMHVYRTGSQRPREPRQVIDDDDDELDRLGAQTKLVFEQKPKLPTPPAHLQPAPASSSSSSNPMGKLIEGFVDVDQPTFVLPHLPPGPSSSSSAMGSLTSPSGDVGGGFGHGYGGVQIGVGSRQQFVDHSRGSVPQLYPPQPMGSQQFGDPANAGYYGSSPTSSNASQYSAPLNPPPPQQQQQQQHQYYSAPNPGSHGHHHAPPMMHPSHSQPHTHLPPQPLQHTLSDPYALQPPPPPQSHATQHWPVHIPGQPVFPPYLSASASSSIPESTSAEAYYEQMDYTADPDPPNNTSGNTGNPGSGGGGGGGGGGSGGDAIDAIDAIDMHRRVYAEHQMRWSEMVQSLEMPAPFVTAIGAGQPQPQSHPQSQPQPSMGQIQSGSGSGQLQRYGQSHHPSG
ncbi:hypothetical protein SISSUDRAFT_447776 [Sistotremastrum suecicum HHB10207 ss-3]|uniref:Zn(2)-C6 fungal-type domain-containing protein n=1 Tax=Sistotremastrum suecicum HHB10207 ss-3 TaxID=1314776 RepID=A0A166FGR5_9AGAM|nr:hypothetical protein SISSUDRAFT_447776 [Sistotremastrum suecicum HHB10207 ss-3]